MNNNKLNNKKKLGLLIGSIFVLLVIILFGPVDIFTHGYFSKSVPIDMLPSNAYKGNVDLGSQEYKIKFKPIKKHFEGFEINLINQSEGNSGDLILTIYNHKDKKIDKIVVDLSKVKGNTWYKTFVNAHLKKNKTYTLAIQAKNCTTYPSLQKVDPDYITSESIGDDALIGYAYADSTFNFRTKVFVIIFILALWALCCSFILENTKIRTGSVLTMLVVILSWNYTFNSMDLKNESFGWFQHDSEALTTSVIEAEKNNVWFGNGEKYGLGNYCDKYGYMSSYERKLIDDDSWANGYSKTAPSIKLDANSYTRGSAVTGNYIKFSNGDIIAITQVNDDGTNLEIILGMSEPLSEYKYGSLDKIRFCDSSQNVLPNGYIITYESQFGLQGKVFKFLARGMSEKGYLPILNMLCCILTASIFVGIVYLLLKKYNLTMAVCFYVTFWLSPWVVNFARNLYWVEFTWFAPMLVGLFCSLKINNKKYRIGSYVAMFLAVLIKCLCGYEYITVIMLGGIAFLLIDFIIFVVSKDKDKARLLFKTIFILGIMAIAGFIVAICIHAPLRGDGNIIEGIKSIIAKDVLRRTNGKNLNDFDDSILEALNSSTWEVYCTYFKFTTQVITGIDANLFPVLFCAPIGIFAYDSYKKKLDVKLLTMYVVLFITSISWFILAKAHSYAHDHMNFVLWYFGFVQICFYICINKVRTCLKGLKS